ncbi:MAG: AIR synthase-related protein [bacterium]
MPTQTPAYDTTKPYKHQLVELIRSTWNTPYASITAGTYQIIHPRHAFSEVDHTDGIGSKGWYHWRAKTFQSAAVDALAMNLNDLAIMGAVPYKIQNHIIIPTDDHSAILAIVTALADKCRQRQIAITGGETSIQTNLDGMELSISMTGVVDTIRPNQFQIGDQLIGLPSNGIHSNGFTKVRQLFGPEMRDDFTRPTVIYLDTILKLKSLVDIHGMMHITGGAFAKLKGRLDGANAIITDTHSLKPQPIFYEIYARGVTDEEMYKTFNCGIGFIIAVAPKDLEIALSQTGGQLIGSVVPGTGKVVVQSALSNTVVEY